LRCGRRGPVSDAGPGEHRRPRGREGTHPGRCSCVRNAVTLWRSGLRSGKPTVRRAEFLGGNRMTEKRNAGSGNATGNQAVLAASFRAVVLDNRPDTGPGARA